jgi:N-acetylneuraminate 9-O-acetyltransferase
MLYYICPLHTLYTLMVYATMAIAPKLNVSLKGQAVKIGACLLVTAVCWESRTVFDTIWSPLTFLVGYQDPRRSSLPVALALSTGVYPGGSGSSTSFRGSSFLANNTDPTATTASIATSAVPDKLHEWHFRSSLDRYVWIYGMACAALKPSLSSWLETTSNTSRWKRNLARSMTAVVALAAGGAWFQAIGSLPKLQYNRLHPFTSWVPITSWILLRNLTPSLRRTHLAVFSWLGCITLETYIAQFHTWLSTEGVPDAQPKGLLELLPITKYPLINFGLCSAVFVFLSRRLYVVTASLNVFAPRIGKKQEHEEVR